ncbi:hypothetical protein JZ751_017516 [Albula glossodonta]|uniref:Uncharacterized protein n=1 Tax=Albula glossodonta TaxID=121402 RepID=A0A8T2PL18_9TELE|nr:hypothetical protein JZ751_017516 [Albula glossodonta]
MVVLPITGLMKPRSPVAAFNSLILLIPHTYLALSADLGTAEFLPMFDTSPSSLLLVSFGQQLSQLWGQSGIHFSQVTVHVHLLFIIIIFLI